jgi:hypothetical protein
MENIFICNKNQIKSAGDISLDVSPSQILVGANLAAWLVSISLTFYYLFVMSSKTDDDRKKRALYLWGIKRFLFCMIWFTVGSSFILMTLDDWRLFCNLISYNMPYIIGVSFWVGFISFVIYFFKYRLPKERKSKGLENNGKTQSKIEEEKKADE